MFLVKSTTALLPNQVFLFLFVLVLFLFVLYDLLIEIMFLLLAVAPCIKHCFLVNYSFHVVFSSGLLMIVSTM